jgi:hypothetical protein
MRFKAASAANLFCFSQSISDGVSILGAEEVSSFRLGKGVKTKSQPIDPPVFEFAMFVLSWVNVSGVI